MAGGPPRGPCGARAAAAAPRSRPGDDLPDSCKLYVGNLSPAVTDTVLKSLMEPFGAVLHAVVLLDHDVRCCPDHRGPGIRHGQLLRAAAPIDLLSFRVIASLSHSCLCSKGPRSHG